MTREPLNQKGEEESTECFTDEVLCTSEVDKSLLSRTDRVLMVIEETMQSEEFMGIQESFADRYCDLFDLEGDLPPECMDIYKEYVRIIESDLLAKIQQFDSDFDFEELIPVLLEHKNDENFQFANAFEFLNAAIDFNEFRSLMASYKNGKGVSLDVVTVRFNDKC
jgi:hypothetical protein